MISLVLRQPLGAGWRRACLSGDTEIIIKHLSFILLPNSSTYSMCQHTRRHQANMDLCLLSGAGVCIKNIKIHFLVLKHAESRNICVLRGACWIQALAVRPSFNSCHNGIGTCLIGSQCHSQRMFIHSNGRDTECRTPQKAEHQHPDKKSPRLSHVFRKQTGAQIYNPLSVNPSELRSESVRRMVAHPATFC